ncbi:thiol reductase thioredoxin [Micractinium conductrix]|uniref:Thiol reductase thioredoxin n=1 Tax=Micractinium conductrix TaxID=554055 RepID=A0A2P6V545_9CHLO|nr:thiol reductase thioredoxin [Micractinium conductrix]|eukprot:PSC69220.1 thiol reductase thioredoxin [Micractinium conductrix]
MKAVTPSWRDRVTFYKIDTEKNAEVAEAVKVQKLPTLILFRGGKQVDRYEGLMSGQDLDLLLRKSMR